MANVSLLASDGINPKLSMHANLDGGERPATGSMAIKVIHSDIPTAANTYVLGKLPVGAAITKATWVVTVAFNDGIDFGISDVNGTTGTEGDLDALQDDSAVNNHTVGIYQTIHASNNYTGHLCVTDSYIVASGTNNLTAGEGTLVVEYVKTL